MFSIYKYSKKIIKVIAEISKTENYGDYQAIRWSF